MDEVLEIWLVAIMIAAVGVFIGWLLGELLQRFFGIKEKVEEGVYKQEYIKEKARLQARKEHNKK